MSELIQMMNRLDIVENQVYRLATPINDYAECRQVKEHRFSDISDWFSFIMVRLDKLEKQSSLWWKTLNIFFTTTSHPNHQHRWCYNQCLHHIYHHHHHHHQSKLWLDMHIHISRRTVGLYPCHEQGGGD